MRVGVIGTGWGLMHVGAFRDAGADVVALCGRDHDKTTAIALREGITLATDDARALVDAVDLVVVASPDANHREHVSLALAAGRAVLCEKPLAITLEDARAMTAAASQHTWIVFPMRALSPFEALQRWLDGRPARIIVNVRSGFAWTGVSGDLGGTSHVLDAVSWLAGVEPLATSATITDDTNALHVEYANGTLAIVTFVRAPEPGIHGSWSIVGDGFEAGFSAGWVPAAGGWCIGPVRVFEGGAWRDLHGPLGPAPGRPEPWALAHRTIARRVSAAMRGEATTLPTFTDGLRVQAIVAAARASSLGRAWTPI